MPPLQKITAFCQGPRAASKIDGIRLYGGDAFDLEVCHIEGTLPTVIDDAAALLPDTIDADLVLDLLAHPDLSYDLGRLCRTLGIPMVSSGKKMALAGVITPPT
jgi:hypothetical protein